MRAIVAIIALLSSLSAQAAPPSDASIEALMQVTRVESTMDSMYAGMEQAMRQIMAQSLKDKKLTAQQQRALDLVPAKFVGVMREEMSWQKMKPMYLQIYRETFDQADVDGMLAFYTSPAGQALIRKMPLVIQKSMALSQSLMQSVLPKMQAAIMDALKESAADEP